MKKHCKKLLAGALLALLIVAMGVIYATFREQAVSGSKQISIAVINSAGNQTTYDLRTDAMYLEQAMEEAEGLTFSGYEGPYGPMLDTVNGETADYNVNGAYWSFTVNGDYCHYGIGQQPVEDGDAFVIAYTK